jgi:transcriptional regulator with XRE-family HTH domain
MAETFADRLKSLRERTGVSQYRLAQLAGLAKQTVSRLELGQIRPSWETVQALARGLGVEVGAFVTDQGAPAEQPPPAKPRGRPRKAGTEAPPAKKPRGRKKGK